MDREYHMNIIDNLKSTWKFWFGIAYFTLLILVITAVYNKHSVKPTPPAPVPEPVAEVKVDLDPLNRRIASLEAELAAHTAQLRTLKHEHDSMFAANQRLERRIQAHTEAFKRLCEYVVVITVDKKLVPRQCLPEYRWTREEG